MRVQLSAAVMHTPWVPFRALTVDRLRRQIPRLRVCADHDREGVWPTARRAWLAHSQLATHHLVLQDDVGLCPGFWRGLPAMVAQAAQQPLYLFSARPAVAKAAQLAGVRWVREPGALWAQAIVLPVPMIHAWLDWLDEQGIGDDWHPEWDDVRLSLYLMAHRLDCWIPVPNPVEHLLPCGSTIGHGGARRISSTYTGEPIHATDWRPGMAPRIAGRSYKAYRKACGL